MSKEPLPPDVPATWPAMNTAFAIVLGMYSITGIETLIAEHIKAIIIANLASKTGYSRDPDTNIYYLLNQVSSISA